MAVAPTATGLARTSTVASRPNTSHPFGGTRLLTLTGAGGCGKTRLAIQFAKQHAHAYADGAWIAELAALTDAALLPQSVASVLYIKEKVGVRLIGTLAQSLAPRSVLLVLDNAEHLIEACAALAESFLRRIRLHHTASTAVNPLREGIGRYLRPIDWARCGW